MKKNIQINLFGTLYNIDEDAYQLLDNYLGSMKRYFSTQEIGNEVADDIEHRVAELLWEKKNSGMEAVNVDVVKEIIGKIGNPQEIDNENSESRNSETSEEAGANSDSNANSNSDSNANAEDKKGWKENLNEMADDATEGAKKTYNNVKSNLAGKKLYRDPYDKVLGGVCSGLAHYIGGDPLLWRIILVIIFLLEGVGLLLYLILWLIVPLARTPEDRLRMSGQAVNPDTLNQQILQDQNTTPVPHENRGCLMGCFGLLMLPFLFLFLTIIYSLIAGLLGGSLGLFGGLLGLSCLPFKYAFGSTFGSSNYELASDPAFWWGIILLVVGLVAGIWLLIHSHKHPEMKSNSKLITVLLIILFLFLGGRGIVKALQNCKHNIEVNLDTDWDDEVDDDDDDDWDDEDSTLNGSILDTTIVDTTFDDNIEFDEDAQVNISNKGVSVTKGGKKINITPNGIKIKKTVTVPKKRVITN